MCTTCFCYSGCGGDEHGTRDTLPQERTWDQKGTWYKKYPIPPVDRMTRPVKTLPSRNFGGGQ